MELMIGEKLRKLRRDRDMTQEMLASAFGVSPQAISKWECGDGYPDITMLPMIANYFKVTIDELLGNDEIGQREDYQLFYNTRSNIKDKVELVEYTLGYVRRYPTDYKLALELTHAITQLPMEKWEEYLPLLRETCEKIINECTVYWIRERAIRDMCIVCPDEELEHWIDMCALSYEDTRGEVMEYRLWKQDRMEESRLQRGINNFMLLCHFITRNDKTKNWKDVERDIAWRKKQIRLFEFLGGGNGVPEVWRGRYAHCTLMIAWMLFRSGRNEEGYAWLDLAFERYEQWNVFPEGAALDTGDPEIFGGIRAICGLYGPDAWKIKLPDGSMEHNRDAYAYMLFEKTDIYHMTLHWGGMDEVRETERFQPYIARAKALAEIED